ncbi:MAG TPA: enoyl-CoA hydratase-related protein, partial [Alphaproteobacteria bacterium]|nr:enoyl-CoA hydratase-related protein [Alphaproteobacteria bacterium]
MKEISVEREGEAAVVTMRRPEKRNALSLAMMRELDAALAGLGADRSVRAVILAGEGPAFSAGHDLRELRGRDEAAYTEIFD